MVAPLAISPALAATNDQFGTSLAMSGNWLAVGVPLDDPNGVLERGSVSTFERVDGAWHPRGKVLAPDGQEGDLFGSSVGLSGNRLVVGAVLDDQGLNSDIGAAYLFEHDGTTWNPVQKFDAGAQAFYRDNYGQAVAIDGDHLVVGASAIAPGGIAFVYRKNSTGTGWSLEEKLAIETGSGALVNTGFAAALALQGTTLLVGENGARASGGRRPGKVHVYVRSGSDWLLQDSIEGPSSSGNESPAFGSALALDGERALISAPASDQGRGMAFIYERSGGKWLPITPLPSPALNVNDSFGRKVGLSGDWAIVTAYSGAQNSTAPFGAAYVFKHETSWSLRQKLLTPLVLDYNRFGADAVVATADTLAIAENGADINGNLDQGAVHLYQPTATGWRHNQTLPGDAFIDLIFADGF
jgi:hypothetical protein